MNAPAAVCLIQDEPPYLTPAGFVYVGEHPFTLDELWSGVDRLEQHYGVSLDKIADALEENWSESVICLARLGRRS